MRLMQILTEGGERAVVATTGPAGAETSAIVPGHRTVYDLARAAIAARSSIEAVVDAAGKAHGEPDEMNEQQQLRHGGPPKPERFQPSMKAPVAL